MKKKNMDWEDKVVAVAMVFWLFSVLGPLATIIYSIEMVTGGY